MHRLSTHRAPTHPGEMFVLEFLVLKMTQVELAERIGVPFQCIRSSGERGLSYSI